MFESNLYKVIASSKETEKSLFTIKINSVHEIFKGHFPNMPVMPGVCSLLIIKRLVSEIVEKQLVFSNIRECKFIAAILPDKCDVADIKIAISKEENDIYKVVSEIIYEGKIVMKLKGYLR